MRGAAKPPIGWSSHWSNPKRSWVPVPCAAKPGLWPGQSKVWPLHVGSMHPKKPNVEQLHFSHTSMSMTFWNGRCKVGASFDKQAAEWWDSRQGHAGPGRCARPPTGRCSLSVATAACLPWRLLLINFRRKGSSASKSTLCWSACRTRTFPHVPLCPLCGSLYWVRKSGGGLRPVQPAVPRRPLSNAGLPVRREAFETREGLRVCRVTVLPCHGWQHLLHWPQAARGSAGGHLWRRWPARCIPPVVPLLLLLDMKIKSNRTTWEKNGRNWTHFGGFNRKLDKPAVALSVTVIILTQSHVGSFESIDAC